MTENNNFQTRIRDLEKQNAYLHQQIKEHRYGLTWIDVPEAFDPESDHKIPVLEEVKEKSFDCDSGNNPPHIIIEGDNFHALTCLQYTHKGKIDVIYIDPPYNTGSGNTDRDPLLLPSDDDRVTLAQNAGVLVSLAENTLSEIAKTDFYQIFTDNNGRFAAVYLQEELSHFEEFKREVEKLQGHVSVYVFCWSNVPDIENSFTHLPDAEVKAYPNAILEAYKKAMKQIENQK